MNCAVVGPEGGVRGGLPEFQDMPCHNDTDITENISSGLLYLSDIWCLYNNFELYILSTFESQKESVSGYPVALQPYRALAYRAAAAGQRS